MWKVGHDSLVSAYSGAVQLAYELTSQDRGSRLHHNVPQTICHHGLDDIERHAVQLAYELNEVLAECAEFCLRKQKRVTCQLPVRKKEVVGYIIMTHRQCVATAWLAS